MLVPGRYAFGVTTNTEMQQPNRLCVGLITLIVGGLQRRNDCLYQTITLTRICLTRKKDLSMRTLDLENLSIDYTQHLY